MPAPTRHHWLRKFQYAGRGITLAVGGQSSFVVHLIVAGLVIAAGISCHLTTLRWCVLVLCIAGVLAAETFNSSLERLVQAVHPEHHDDVGAALDMAGGAVLVASLGAAVVGCLVFLA